MGGYLFGFWDGLLLTMAGPPSRRARCRCAPTSGRSWTSWPQYREPADSSGLGALLGGPGGGRQVQGGVDQADVRERLREVAQKPAGLRVVLLREQAHVVAQPQQPFEPAAGLGVAALQVQAVSQPEGAG